MTKKFQVCVTAGDGIGPEIVAEAIKVLHAVEKKYDVEFDFKEALIGGAAIDATGNPLPDETLELAKASDAVLLGAVGGPKWDTTTPGAPRPEQGLLKIRKELGLYANLRPIQIYDSIASNSPLKTERVKDVDILIMRELTGGLYFGDHVTQENVAGAGGNGKPGAHAYDVMQYDEYEIERIIRRGFDAAMKRHKRVTSVDKANVLDTSRLWRKIAQRVSKEYPQVEYWDMLVDNCAMQIINNPSQFDVIITENTFGDILSDEASMLCGSLGLLASASLGDSTSLYEPSHGSAPKHAGKNDVNPISQIQSAAMMLKYSFDMDDAAADIDNAVRKALADGWCTYDIAQADTPADHILSTSDMGTKIAERI
ncbi:MAG: 3-isopropylmalate dehydrogenase [Coriobacteriales bacterium]|jgi:3-isopropylmalate dehydrogenase